MLLLREKEGKGGEEKETGRGRAVQF